MHLYKYVREPKYILEEGYIRATQKSALNDPFEANYSKKALRDLIKEIDCELDSTELIKYIKVNKHKVGVISFTEAKDNLLMWSHYANEHKGALIGFSATGFNSLFMIPTLSTAFDTLYDYYDGKCHPVIYRKQPLYKVDKFDRDYSNFSVEGGDRILFEIFLQKSDEWIYEKEHRIILKLSQADKVVLDDINKYKDIKFIDNILNGDYGDYIEKPLIKEVGQKIHIYLDSIKDEINRSIWGDSLANLAKDNPEILYLFKIDSSSISSITYGMRTDEEIRNQEYSYIKKTAYFERYKTTLYKKSYTLKFKEMKKKV